MLVDRHRNLVRACVRRFRSSPGSADDLIQVGYIGLMKAINNYDPAAGGSLAGYAQPTIIGELMRTSATTAGRSTSSARPGNWPARSGGDGGLTQELGRPRRTPSWPEAWGWTGPAARRPAGRGGQPPFSLDAPVRGGSGITALAELLGEDDGRIEHMLSMQAVAAHWGGLPVGSRPS